MEGFSFGVALPTRSGNLHSNLPAPCRSQNWLNRILENDFIGQAEAASTGKAAAQQAVRQASLPVDVSGAG